jgi:GT2 family glycosyltransferase
MSAYKVSVIIPTRNRPRRLSKTLEGLLRQDLPCASYEIIVVDDGSTPPVSLNTNDQLEACTLIRLEGVERSAARNQGAAIAVGEILLFLDDDMAVGPDFLSTHLRANEEWPGALIVGGVSLPEEALATPFGRFRQRLEQRDTPRLPGPSANGNFCTAANMSISRGVFAELGGFDIGMSSSEDQDLALRHTARGGEMVFLPAAQTIHLDHSLDIRSYCLRAEWGSRNMVPFCERHPDLPNNVERDRVNGPLHLNREPVSQSARKLVKRALSTAPVVALLFGVASLLERSAPNGSGALDRVYRLVLGAHIFRGHREGLKRSLISPSRSAMRPNLSEDSCLQTDR